MPITRGRSKIRNRAIAEVFSRMEIIEAWGTGIRRIVNRAKEYGLPEPEFQEIGNTFRVNLFRASPKTSLKVSPKINPKVSLKTSLKVHAENQDLKTNLTEQQKTIIELIKIKPRITQAEIADSIGKSLATVKGYIAVLRKDGIVEYIGSSKNGEWIVRENTADGK